MFCTYITVHEPTGRYYIGKGKTSKVVAGTYKGSGTLLVNTFKKYPPEEWKCGVLWTFDTEAEAFSDEAQLITDEMLNDPLCMNLIPGGVGPQHFMSSPKKTDEDRAEYAAKLKASGKALWDDPAYREKVLTARSTPAVKAKLSKARARPCTIDGITIYPGLRVMERHIGQGKTGSRSPNFRYLDEEKK